MTVTIVSNETAEVSLAEYVDYCHDQKQISDMDTVLSSAYMLQRLANNQNFFLDFLNEKLKDIVSYNVKTDFTPPSFYLYQSAEFSVRAVLWLPCDKGEEDAVSKGYGVTHNHHFDFLTCGYYGPGYRTIIHQCEPDKVSGVIGEKVDMKFQEDSLLTVGKLMLYQHTRDIHVQLPPESLSISLNLVFPSHPEAGIQCAFDPNNQTVLAHLDVLPATTRIMNVARLLHNDATVERLEQIALKHCCPRTRAMSLETLLSINPADGERYLASSHRDRSLYVRKVIGRSEINN